MATINSSSGRATAVSAGSATITATGGSKTGTATLTVTEPPPIVSSVSVSPSSASIEEGETQRFTATAYTSDNAVISGKTFAWTSSMASVATINSSGLATGVDAGSTTITATVDGKSGTALLTVAERMLRSKSGTISGRYSYSAGGSVTLSETTSGNLRLEIDDLETPSGAPDVYLVLPIQAVH